MCVDPPHPSVVMLFIDETKHARRACSLGWLLPVRCGGSTRQQTFVVSTFQRDAPLNGSHVPPYLEPG
jgi:hypothetical protein